MPEGSRLCPGIQGIVLKVHAPQSKAWSKEDVRMILQSVWLGGCRCSQAHLGCCVFRVTQLASIWWFLMALRIGWSRS